MFQVTELVRLLERKVLPGADLQFCFYRGSPFWWRLTGLWTPWVISEKRPQIFIRPNCKESTLLVAQPRSVPDIMGSPCDPLRFQMGNLSDLDYFKKMSTKPVLVTYGSTLCDTYILLSQAYEKFDKKYKFVQNVVTVNMELIIYEKPDRFFNIQW